MVVIFVVPLEHSGQLRRHEKVKDCLSCIIGAPRDPHSWEAGDVGPYPYTARIDSPFAGRPAHNSRSTPSRHPRSKGVERTDRKRLERAGRGVRSARLRQTGRLYSHYLFSTNQPNRGGWPRSAQSPAKPARSCSPASLPCLLRAPPPPCNEITILL